MVLHETRNNIALVLIHSPVKIIGVADIEISASAMQHICPERQRQSFDRLRTNG